MKIFLPRTSSALTTTILSATMLIAPIAHGNDTKYVYNPSAEVTTKFSKGRNIAELNYMQPFLANDNNLPIIDLKLKLDNKKSKEINLGLVYRYNYEDKAILGTYAYFDHRHTSSNFSVNSLTAGVEVLSKYIDARANVYIPQNKRKKLAHNSNKTVEIKGTSIFALSGGHKYESALRGYDIEVGAPLFAFSESLNDQFGTKVFAARYSFSGKNVKAINGTRFRIEQDIGKIWLGDNSYKFQVNAETQFDKVRKRQNFIGLGLKVNFNDKKNSYQKKSSGLKHRMMDTVIRDVDIITASANEEPTKSNFHMGGKEIKKIYYVGSAQTGYSGDGTKNNPMSLEQVQSLNCDDAVIIVTKIDQNKGGTTISRQDYAKIKEMPQVLNGKEQVLLSTIGSDKVSITVKGGNGISIINPDATIIVEGNNTTPVSTTEQSSTIQLLEPQITADLTNQIEAARVEHQRATDMLQELSVEITQTQIAEMPYEVSESEAEQLNAIARNLAERVINSWEQEAVAQQPEANQMVYTVEEEAQVLEEILSQPDGTFTSGVNRDDLSPVEKELYDLIINCEASLSTNGELNNPFVIKQMSYNKVASIIEHNPNLDIDGISQLIESYVNLSPVVKTKYKNIATAIMGFNGKPNAPIGPQRGGPQHGMDANGIGVRDQTSATSLEKLKNIYGLLDGDTAISLAKSIAIEIIKDNIPNVGADIDTISLNHKNTVPTAEYKEAAKLYLDNLKAPERGETDIEKTARETNLNNAKSTISKEIKTSLTAVNNSMAAYRALVQAENNPGSYYEEKILGRYDDKEMLAYAIMANLDVREIKNNLIEANTPVTSRNIFARQQENLQGLINQLGMAQRTYNMDHGSGSIDIGGIDGLYPDNREPRSPKDTPSCAHGYCVRIVDSMIHHSKVNLSDVSPGSLSDEFGGAVKGKFCDLGEDQKILVRNWQADVEEVTIGVNNGSVIFSTPAGGDQVDIPDFYKTILTDVAAELDSRYNFTHPNPKLQLVKKDNAIDVFKNVNYIGLD